MSSQKNVIDQLVSQNDKLRQELHQVRREKEDLNRAARKLEGEIKSMELKCKVIEGQRDKHIGETRRFMEALEQEKKERVQLLTQNSELKNLLVRKDTDLAKLTAEVENSCSENLQLKKQVQTLNITQVGVLKEKQSTVNTAKLMETKLEASEMEKKYLNSRVAQLEAQLKNSKQELKEMTAKYHEKQIGVQVIYRDDEETKEKLLVQFQHKISDKDEETKSQLQMYLNENSSLKHQLLELQNELNK